MKFCTNKKFWIVTLFILQIVLFYSVFYQYLHKMPYIQSDEALYIYQSYRILHNLARIYVTQRPVFTIFAILIIKVLKLPFVYNLLLTLNTVIYHLIFLCSLWYITRNLKLNRAVFLCTTSIVYAMPVFFSLSTCILGDVPVFSWIFLTTALLMSLFNPKYRKSKLFILGVVLALGFQTKPIFLFASLILIYSLTFVYLSRKILVSNLSDKIPFKEFMTSLSAFIIGFLPTLYLVYPKNLVSLIHELNYNNEMMGYYTVYNWIFNNVLWFPLAVFLVINLFVALIITSGFFSKVIQIIKEFINKTSKDFSVQGMKDYYLKLTESRISFFVLSFAVMVMYASFCVKAKDPRVFFFLIPIYVFLSVIAINSLFKKRELFNNLLIGILIYNIFCTGFLLYNKQISLFNLAFDIQQFKFINCDFELQGMPNYKNTRVLDIVDKIDEYNNAHEKLKNITVFLPHNATYNKTVFNAVSMFSSNLYGFLPGITKKIKAKQGFESAMFYHGSSYIGDYSAGGIPASFFTANFIVLVKNNYEGAYKGQVEIYNKVIAKKLSEQDPLFLEGLKPIYKTKNNNNEEIIVYKRFKTVQNQTFAKIVDAFTQYDKDNLFNVPFIYGALLVNPNLKNLREQMEKMSDPKFIKSVDYVYESQKNKGLTQYILSSWKSKCYYNKKTKTQSKIK